jgi:hypothetical protein
MTKRYNYEDTIFAITLQVRCLHDMLKLEIDPDLFTERILADIAWIDVAIASLAKDLQAGSPFVRRHEHLRELRALMRAFVEALDLLLEKRSPVSAHIPEKLEGLGVVRQRLQGGIDGIKSSLAAAGTQEEEHIVSPEELRFLMSTPADEEQGGSGGGRTPTP